MKRPWAIVALIIAIVLLGIWVLTPKPEPVQIKGSLSKQALMDAKHLLRGEQRQLIRNWFKANKYTRVAWELDACCSRISVIMAWNNGLVFHVPVRDHRVMVYSFLCQDDSWTLFDEALTKSD